MVYCAEPDVRLFPLTKYGLTKAMKSGSKAAGVKRIRVHDLRHSHVSLLINNGFTAFEIGKRVGHSAEKITLRYYGKKNLMTSCPGRYLYLLPYPPEQLSIINASIR